MNNKKDKETNKNIKGRAVKLNKTKQLVKRDSWIKKKKGSDGDDGVMIKYHAKYVGENKDVHHHRCKVDGS